MHSKEYIQGYNDGHDNGYSAGLAESGGYIPLWIPLGAFAFGLIVGCLLP